MPELSSAEEGDPIDRTAIRRALLLAFAIWMGHFVVAYGAVLVFPEQSVGRWIAGIAGIVACGLLVLLARGLPRPRSALALGAAGLAIVGVVFGTLPAIVG